MAGRVRGFLRMPQGRPPEPPATLIVGSAGSLPEWSPDWRLFVARDLRQAETFLMNHEIALVLYDRDAPGDWRQAVAVLSGAPSRPCVVLLSESDNGELWDQVTGSGGYDVLRKPVRAEALRRTLRSGISLWRSGRELDSMRRLPDRR
ncbi:MAG: hypothetical protein M1436_03600 [Acidobacteria bacterium]|nr:hypothetical protein [Acidobacteriota bacterium]